jgi:molecular chaperone GrpE
MMIDEKQSATTPQHNEETLDSTETLEVVNQAELDNSQDTAETSPTSAVLETETEDSLGLPSDTQMGELMLMIETLQQENGLLKEQLDQQKAQNEAIKSQYIRNVADFENFRKRTSREKEDLEYQVKRNTLTELLPAIDNFERARLQIKPANDGEMAIHKSYQGVYKQIVDVLKRIGVSPMRPEGQPFDPNLHEAVFREPTDEYEEGVVMEQLVRGYLLGDRVLRHAMVKVAATKEDTPISDTESEEISQPQDIETEVKNES